MVITDKLKGRIIEYGFSLKEFAKLINLTPAELSRKLHNKTAFKVSETVKICGILNITKIDDYFSADN